MNAADKSGNLQKAMGNGHNAYLVDARSITVTRQDKVILQDVSLSIGSHDFITIIGPNGAGKSVLLKTILGFFQPDKGTIQIKDGLKIGYVPQRITPDNTMPISTKKFITLRKTVSSENIKKIAKETGIEKILDKPLFVLSGGELQRALLARALLDEPDLLILDEPAQNLDISGQLAFYKLIERIFKQRNISILMVSHDLHMVMATTKKVVCLYHHICCSGEPHVVTKDPEFISLFGNDMARMMAVYQHDHHHKH